MKKIINYYKKTNFLAIFIFILFIIIFSHDSANIRIGSFWESFFLYFGLFSLFIILNSNNIFSIDFFKKNKAKEIINFQIEILEKTNYYFIFSIIFLINFFIITYLLIKYSNVLLVLLSFIILMLLFIFLINYIKVKKKLLSKLRKINIKKQEIFLSHFGIPILFTWGFLLYNYKYIEGNLKIVLIILVLIFNLSFIIKGIMKLRQLT
jgi:hypothetical protein